MSKLQNLYEEITLRNPEDLAARALHLLASATGSLKRALPAEELTTPEFMSLLQAVDSITIEEFITRRNESPAPWEGIPHELIDDSIMETANRAVDQHFIYAGGEHTFNGTVDWHHTLNTANGWPLAHWSEIPFRRLGSIGDIKSCWEMNRHQFFPALALAYLKTDDVKYISTLKNFIHSWCDQNTPETGIHYISNLEIGLRIIAWHFTERLLKDVDVFDESTRERLHKNLYSQTRHLAEYISYTEKTGKNNHLIGDAVSLAFMALTHPEWKTSKAWFKKGIGILWRNFDTQVYPDGMHFEGSYGYHLFVTEFIMLLFAEMRRQKLPIPAKGHMLLEKMATILQDARQPDGELPNINDNDNGYVLPLPLSTIDRIQGILATAAILYQRPDFKASSGGAYPLYSHLLLGEAGKTEQIYITIYPESAPELILQKESGIGIMRQKGHFALLKNNPDPFPQSGHNHADLLNLLLYIDGKPVLVDAGTYRYNADRGFRNALRSTQAHNTIAIDLKPQATPNRNFGWISRTESGDIFAGHDANAILLDADHHSYASIGAIHRRVVAYLRHEEAFVVVDRMSGEDTHYFEQFWHFPIGATLETIGERAYKLMQGSNCTAHITFFRENDHDSHEIMFGTDRNKISHVSLTYGEIEPATTLKHSWTSTLAAHDCSHRITVFSKDAFTGTIAHKTHGVFDIGDYRLDLTVTPATLVRV